MRARARDLGSAPCRLSGVNVAVDRVHGIVVVGLAQMSVSDWLVIHNSLNEVLHGIVPVGDTREVLGVSAKQARTAMLPSRDPSLGSRERYPEEVSITLPVAGAIVRSITIAIREICPKCYRTRLGIAQSYAESVREQIASVLEQIPRM